jgi:hypothetical protein
MATSASQFEAYYEEYLSLIEEIDNNPIPEERERLVRASRDLLHQMMVEARSCDDVSMKQEMLERVKMYTSQIQALHQQTARDTLLDERSRAATKQPARHNRALERQNDTIERALISLQETEDIGRETIQELGRNRETMQAAHSNTKQVSTLTDQANVLLKSMNVKWWQPSFYQK